MGLCIDIPYEKLGMIRQQYASGDDESQCRQKCWELYLTEHPSPSWKQVAEALYHMDQLQKLDVVQKRYLKGECSEWDQCRKTRLNVHVLASSSMTSNV